MSFSFPPLRYPQPFVAPKPLDVRLIHCPAFCAGVMAGGPEPSARMVLGVGAQPIPQGGVWTGWCRCGGFVTLGGPVLPGHAADEPFTDPQHTL